MSNDEAKQVRTPIPASAAEGETNKTRVECDMTYYFETYGCQMNLAESASIERLFIARGW